MDLLATVRKEGSRGGAGDFKWSDVQNSTRREHYLGHSLMAPVGRWQKGRDLNWYAKTDEDGGDAVEREAQERKEEIRRIKEAEQDAMAQALGLPVPDRSNPNMQELGGRKDIDKAIKDTIGGSNEDGGRGVGFGSRGTTSGRTSQVVSERMEGNVETQDRELEHALKEYKRRHHDHKSRRRSRSRSRSRDRERRHLRRERDREPSRRHRSGSREGHRRRRTRSPEQRRRHRDRREASRSPRRKDKHESERRKRYD